MAWDDKGWKGSVFDDSSGWKGSGWEENKRREERWQKMQAANNVAKGDNGEKLTLFGILSRFQSSYAWEKKIRDSGFDRRELSQFAYNFQALEYWEWFRFALKQGFTEVFIFTLLLPLAILVELHIINLYNGDRFYELFFIVLLFAVNIGFTAFFLYLAKFVVGDLTKRMFAPLAFGRALPLFLKALFLVGLAFWLSPDHLPPNVISTIAHYTSYLSDMTEKEIYYQIYEGLPRIKEGLLSSAFAFAAFGALPLLIHKFRRLPEGGYRDWIKSVQKKECKLDLSKNMKKELHFGCGIRIYPELPEVENLKVRKIFQVDAERETHTDVMGTTGVGKTRLAESLIEQDIRIGNSVIVIDPKPDWDLFARIINAAIETNRADEIVFISLLHPHISSGINPLKYYVYPDEIISTIVSTIQSGDEFFVNIAREMATLIVNGLYFLNAQTEGTRKTFTYSEILRYISQEGLGKIANEIENHKDLDPDRVTSLLENYRQTINSPKDYFNKVVSTLRTNVSNFSHGVVGSIVGKADDNFVIERLESGKRVICYVMTGSQVFSDKANQLSRVLLAMINNLAGRLNTSGMKLPYPLRIHVDEAYTALYHGIENLFDKARSTGIGLVMYHQSIGQYVESIGEQLTQTIMDNINTFFFMRVTKKETQEFASRMTGTRLTALPTFSISGHAGMFPNETYRIPPEAFADLPPRMGILVRTNARNENASKVVDLIKTPLIKLVELKVKPADLRAVTNEEEIVKILRNYM